MSWRGFIGASLAAVLMTGAVGLPGASGDGRLEDREGSGSRSARGPCWGQDYLVRPRMGLEEVQRRVKALIRCAAERFPVPGGASQAISVAECESGLWPWARNGSSRGVFQQNVGPSGAWWRERVSRWLRPEWFWQLRDGDPSTWPSVFNARANVLVSARMAHAGGWGPWSCA